jgi:molybdate transport system regulatory protein
LKKRRAAAIPRVVCEGARVWIEIEGQTPLGQGRAALLEAIDRHGSIPAAAAALGVSYRAAWRWIDLLNRVTGRSMVETETGGARGGGARLTPWGQAALAAQRLANARDSRSPTPRHRATGRRQRSGAGPRRRPGRRGR